MFPISSKEHPNGRKVGGSGHDVIRHLAVLHAAILPNDFLVQRVSNSLRDAARDLPAGQDRMQHLANFLQRHKVVDRRAVRRQINRHFRDIDRPGKGRVRFSAIFIIVPEHIGRRFVACPRSELTRWLQPDSGTRTEIPRPNTNRQASPLAIRVCLIPNAADCTSLPTTMTVREATVGPLFGTSFVSAGAISTLSYGNPSASAAIWQRTVFVPWPNSVLETSTLTLPSAHPSTPTTDPRLRSPEPVNPAPCKKAAMPIPFLLVPDLILFCEALLFSLIVGEFQRPVEKFFQIDGLAHDLLRGCRLPRLQKVSLPNFDRR